MVPPAPLGDLAPVHRVLLVADLSGYHRAFRTLDDVAMAAFLHRFYTVAEAVVSEAGGTVVKFMGDAVLGVFPGDAGPAAVSTAVALEARVGTLTREAGLEMRLGANVHAGPVVEAELGSGSSRRLDVIGRVVNQTFLLGRGAGIRISERVYRSLPSGERGPWEKHAPPAVYVLGEGERA